MPNREKLEEIRWDSINQERWQHEDAENALARREATRIAQQPRQGSLPMTFKCAKCKRDLISAHSFVQHAKFCRGS
jgi:hypothetical protein